MDYSHDYSFDEARQLFIDSFQSDSAKFLFNTSSIDIGVSDSKIITCFSDKNHKPIPFWDFCSTIRDSSRRLYFYVLTTLVNSCSPNPRLSDISQPDSFTSSYDESRSSFSNTKNSTRNSIESSSDESRSSFDNTKNTKATTVPKKVFKKILPQKCNPDSCKENSRLDKSENVPNKFLKDDSCAIILEEKKVNQEVACDITPVSTAATLNNNKSSTVLTEKTPNIINKPLFKKPVAPVEAVSNQEKVSAVSKKNISTVESRLQNLNINLLQIKECDLQFSTETLGAGAQGVVKKATWAGTTVAIKTLPMISFDKLVFREIALMEKIRHENFINVMAICSTPNQFHVVMEYCNGMTLYDMIFKIPETIVDLSTKNLIGLQICRGINFIHKLESPIIHRDIKPANIMVDVNNKVKICDLGLAKCKNLSHRLQTTVCGVVRGTIVYMAPEILLHRSEATTKSDVWSTCLTLVELYTYQTAYELSMYDYFDIYGSMKRLFTRHIVPDVKCFPLLLRTQANQCLKLKPENRSDIEQLLHAYEFNYKLEQLYKNKLTEVQKKK